MDGKMALGWAEIPKPSLVKEDLNVKERGRCLTEPRPGDQEERGSSQHIRLTLTVPISTTPKADLDKSQLRNSMELKGEEKSWHLKKKKTNKSSETSQLGFWKRKCSLSSPKASAFLSHALSQQHNPQPHSQWVTSIAAKSLTPLQMLSLVWINSLLLFCTCELL